MPDDEPLDDARAVAAAAAAAAARVTETVARHVSDTKTRERVALERLQDQRTAQQALITVGQEVGRKVEPGYDSIEQRGKRDAVREEAGVPVENRRVIATADQMNGQYPTLAAAVGKAQKTQTRPTSPVQERVRGR